MQCQQTTHGIRVVHFCATVQHSAECLMSMKVSKCEFVYQYSTLKVCALLFLYLFFLIFYVFVFVYSGLSDGGPPSGCSLQSQSSFDFCSPPTPSQTQAQGQGDPFQTSKDNSPFPDAEVINPFSSSTGMKENIIKSDCPS